MITNYNQNVKFVFLLCLQWALDASILYTIARKCQGILLTAPHILTPHLTAPLYRTSHFNTAPQRTCFWNSGKYNEPNSLKIPQIWFES